MARLSLFLLGPLAVGLDTEPVISFETDKVRALLAYLAVEADRPHRRQELAGLLWPDWPERSARANLRNALSNLRKAIGDRNADPPFLLISRDSLQFNAASNHWLDVHAFGESITADPADESINQRLEEALDLYRGPFLEGFSLKDSAAFDEWQLFQTESLRQDLAWALDRLVQAYALQRAYRTAIPYARRWLALDPLHEPAHRQLMQLYAWSDQRAAALRQYAECETVLREELGLSPDEETTELNATIKERRDLAPPGDGKAALEISQTDALHERYHLEAEIGRGGMGIVYRARDTLLERDVAVKELSTAALDADGRARLLHEARAAASLNHPNIASVFDAGEAGGQLFIVMELVEGGSLHERRPRELKEIIRVARQICSALEHAHAQGVVHRDLKPENVLLAGDGTVKLVDFGLARSVASRLTSEGTIAGTVCYLAPELALGQEFDGRADLYALGVMFYELTTGRLPFMGDDPVAVITQHLHAPVVPPRAKKHDVPLALDALIMRLLSKSPQDRPASAADVLAVLEQPDILASDVASMEELPVLERMGRGRMVGREQEFGQARALWNKTLSGQGQTMLVSGDPGIGKTRLVQELVTQVRVAGSTALVGAWYAEGGGPYTPFTQILRKAFQNGAGVDLDLPAFVLADLLTIAPALRLRFPDIPPNQALDPQAEQQRVFESVITFCTALSERAPLLLVLEDAHWADGDTLSLFRQLARRAQRQRMMLVTTYREGEVDNTQPFQQVQLDLNREGLVTCLKLTQLDRERARHLLAALFDEAITPGFLENIYGKTEGNPFFMVEVCKALVESGELYYAEGGWKRRTAGELQIPQSVRMAVQSRVSKLLEEAQDALLMAAVIGREFDFDTLAEASQQDEETLIDALEAAERAQLIEEVNGQGGVTFTFAHALIPSTLYEDVSTLRRRRLHRSVAVAIEIVRPDDETLLGGLAHHYAEAGDQERARTYYLRAGEHARRLVALGEAAGHYRAALERWPDAEQSVRAETLRKLGECLYIIGHFQEALEVYEESYAVFETVGDRVGSGAVQRLVGRLYWKLGKREESLKHYHSALRILDDGSESVELARAVSAISRIHMVATEYDEAVVMGERALALAERLGAEDVTVHALNNIGVSLLVRDPERGLSMLQDSLRRALALGLPYHACRAYYNLGWGFESRCRYSKARATFVDLLTYAERVRATPFVIATLVEIARLDWHSGQWAAALTRRPQILGWFTSFPVSSVPGLRANTLFGEMFIELGQTEAARAELESSLPNARSAAELQTTVPHLGQLARVYARLGMESETAAVVQEIVGWIDGFPYAENNNTMPLLYACQWSVACAGDEGLGEANACLRRLERAHEQWDSPETDACLSEGRGIVVLAAGDHRGAVGLLRHAVARWEEMGRPYDQARALSGLGHAQVGAGDPVAARVAFDQALGVYDSLAAQLDEAELKRSFLDSGPVREARKARAALQTPD